MNAAPFGLDPASVDALGGALLQFVIQGTLIAVALAVTLRVTAGASAQTRYVAACTALLLMLAAPVTTFFTLRSALDPPAPPPDALPVLESAPTSAAAVLDEPAGSGEPGVADVSSSSALISAEAGPASPTRRVSSLSIALALVSSWRDAWSPSLTGRLMPWLVTAWTLGVALLTLRLLGGWWLVRRLGRASHQALDRWRGPMARLAREMGVTRAVRLCQSTRIDVPLTLGWLKPIILLPASAVSGLGPAQIEAILAHELAHIRRHDYLVNLLQSVVETLLFYHPAVWWVSRRIREERELCCDDLAVRACGDAVTYARALCELEEIRAREPRLALAATGGSLVTRIARLIGHPRVADGRGGIAATALAAVFVVTLAAAGLGVTPRGTNAGAPEADGLVAMDPEDEAIIAAPCETDDCAPPAVMAEPAEPAAVPEPSVVEIAGEAVVARVATPVATAELAGSTAELSASLELLGERVGALVGELMGPAAPEVACGDEEPEADEEEEEDETPFPSLAPLPPFTPAPAQPQIVPVPRTTPRPRVYTTQNVTRTQARASRPVARAPQATVNPQLSQDWTQLYPKRSSVPTLSDGQMQRLEQMGVTRDYVRRVSRQLAKTPSADDLRRLFNNGVTPEYLSNLRRAGLDELTADDAARLASNGVNSSYIASLHGLDPDELGTDNLIRLASNGVTAEWYSAMRWLGYEDLSVDEAVRMRNHGLMPDQVGQLNALARRPYTPEELVRMASNGVTADYVARLRGRLRQDLTAQDLVRLRQNGVSASDVATLEALGYTRLSSEELVRLRQNGVDADYVAELLGAGLDRPEVEELVRLRQNGVDADFVGELRAAGWSGLSVEELIRFRRNGGPPRRER